MQSRAMIVREIGRDVLMEFDGLISWASSDVVGGTVDAVLLASAPTHSSDRCKQRTGMSRHVKIKQNDFGRLFDLPIDESSESGLNGHRGPSPRLSHIINGFMILTSGLPLPSSCCCCCSCPFRFPLIDLTRPLSLDPDVSCASTPLVPAVILGRLSPRIVGVGEEAEDGSELESESADVLVERCIVRCCYCCCANHESDQSGRCRIGFKLSAAIGVVWILAMYEIVFFAVRIAEYLLCRMKMVSTRVMKSECCVLTIYRRKEYS